MADTSDETRGWRDDSQISAPLASPDTRDVLLRSVFDENQSFSSTQHTTGTARQQQEATLGGQPSDHADVVIFESISASGIEKHPPRTPIPYRAGLSESDFFNLVTISPVTPLAASTLHGDVVRPMPVLQNKKPLVQSVEDVPQPCSADAQRDLQQESYVLQKPEGATQSSCEGHEEHESNDMRSFEPTQRQEEPPTDSPRYVQSELSVDHQSGQTGPEHVSSIGSGSIPTSSSASLAQVLAASPATEADTAVDDSSSAGMPPKEQILDSQPSSPQHDAEIVQEPVDQSGTLDEPADKDDEVLDLLSMQGIAETIRHSPPLRSTSTAPGTIPASPLTGEMEPKDELSALALATAHSAAFTSHDAPASCTKHPVQTGQPAALNSHTSPHRSVTKVSNVSPTAHETSIDEISAAAEALHAAVHATLLTIPSPLRSKAAKESREQTPDKESVTGRLNQTQQLAQTQYELATDQESLVHQFPDLSQIAHEDAVSAVLPDFKPSLTKFISTPASPPRIDRASQRRVGSVNSSCTSEYGTPIAQLQSSPRLSSSSQLSDTSSLNKTELPIATVNPESPYGSSAPVSKQRRESEASEVTFSTRSTPLQDRLEVARKLLEQQHERKGQVEGESTQAQSGKQPTPLGDLTGQSRGEAYTTIRDHEESYSPTDSSTGRHRRASLTGSGTQRRFSNASATPVSRPSQTSSSQIESTSDATLFNSEEATLRAELQRLRERERLKALSRQLERQRWLAEDAEAEHNRQLRRLEDISYERQARSIAVRAEEDELYDRLKRYKLRAEIARERRRLFDEQAEADVAAFESLKMESYVQIAKNFHMARTQGPEKGVSRRGKRPSSQKSTAPHPRGQDHAAVAEGGKFPATTDASATLHPTEDTAGSGRLTPSRLEGVPRDSLISTSEATGAAVGPPHLSSRPVEVHFRDRTQKTRAQTDNNDSSALGEIKIRLEGDLDAAEWCIRGDAFVLKSAYCDRGIHVRLRPTTKGETKPSCFQAHSHICHGSGGDEAAATPAVDEVTEVATRSSTRSSEALERSPSLVSAPLPWDTSLRADSTMANQQSSISIHTCSSTEEKGTQHENESNATSEAQQDEPVCAAAASAAPIEISQEARTTKASGNSHRLPEPVSEPRSRPIESDPALPTVRDEPKSATVPERVPPVETIRPAQITPRVVGYDPDPDFNRTMARIDMLLERAAKWRRL